MPRLIPRQLAKVLYQLTKDAQKDQLDVAIREFLLFVKQEHMMSKMDAIIEEFVAYAKQQEGVVDLEITTAHDVSQEVVKSIEKRFGDKVETTTKKDESLIGGVVVKAGNTIFDASIKTQLQQLKRTMNT